MLEEESLIGFVSGGGRLSAPDNATPRYRAELMRLMAIFVDSEMAGAAGFADCINLAPGLRERITAARIVLEKLGHAQQVLQLMGRSGQTPASTSADIPGPPASTAAPTCAPGETTATCASTCSIIRSTAGSMRS